MNKELVFAIGIIIATCFAIILSATFIAGILLLIATVVLNAQFEIATWIMLTIIIAVIEGLGYGLMFLVMD
jgi:hypothetical protein